MALVAPFLFYKAGKAQPAFPANMSFLRFYTGIVGNFYSACRKNLQLKIIKINKTSNFK